MFHAIFYHDTAKNSNIETAPSHDNAVKNTVAPGFCNPSATIYNVQL